MIKNFNLVEDGEKFGCELEIPVYNGETVSFTFDVGFTYSKANVKLNNLFIGSITGNQIGVHSSKIKDGVNYLSVYFFDDKNCLLKGLDFSFTKRPTVRGKASIEEEFTELYEVISTLYKRIEELKSWRKEIDNERSGY